MKKIVLPYYKQKNADNCGPAAISMAVEAIGITIDQSDITDVILKKNNSSGLKNSFFQDMCGYLKDQGLNPLYVGGLSDELAWKLLRTYTRKNIPVIVLQRYSTTHSRSHFRVITGQQYNEKMVQHRIFYHDPVDGPNQIMMKNDFFNLWHPTKGSDQLRPNELLIIQKNPFTIPENQCNFCKSKSIIINQLDLPNVPPAYSYVNPETQIKSTCIQFDCRDCRVSYMVTK